MVLGTTALRYIKTEKFKTCNLKKGSRTGLNSNHLTKNRRANVY